MSCIKIYTLEGVNGWEGGGGMMNIWEYLFFNTYCPDMTVSCKSHKNEVVEQYTKAYGYNNKDICDWGIKQYNKTTTLKMLTFTIL